MTISLNEKHHETGLTFPLRSESEIYCRNRRPRPCLSRTSCRQTAFRPRRIAQHGKVEAPHPVRANFAEIFQYHCTDHDDDGDGDGRESSTPAPDITHINPARYGTDGAKISFVDDCTEDELDTKSEPQKSGLRLRKVVKSHVYTVRL